MRALAPCSPISRALLTSKSCRTSLQVIFHNRIVNSQIACILDPSDLLCLIIMLSFWQRFFPSSLTYCQMTSFSAVSLQGEEEKLSMQRSFCTLQCWSGASKDHTVLVRCFTKTSFSENQRVYMPTLNGAEESWEIPFQSQSLSQRSQGTLSRTLQLYTRWRLRLLLHLKLADSRPGIHNTHALPFLSLPLPAPLVLPKQMWSSHWEQQWLT